MLTTRHCSRRWVWLVCSGLLALAPMAWAAETPASKTSPAWIEFIASNPVLSLFVIVGAGMLFGQIKIAGLSLGSSGVLFAALLGGHLGLNVSRDVGVMGLVLFVYGVGLAAGPSFFRAFVRQGKTLAQLSLAVVVAGAITTIAFAKLAGVDNDLAVGIFAGSLTSTPALATAVEKLGEGSNVSIGYGVAYPFGVIGVVLFVQLLPRLLGKPLETLQDESESSKHAAIVRTLVEVTNPTCFGKPWSDIGFSRENPVAITRVLVGQKLAPISPDYVLNEGDCVYVVGDGPSVATMTELLGKEAEREFVVDSERERQRIVVTNPAVVGQTLGQLKPLQNHAVSISRITRQDIDFAPQASTQLRPGDVLTAVGDQSHLEAFAVAMGHRAKAVDETDLISLAVGLVLGVLAGQVTMGLGTGAKISLGLAGGPLLVALVLGHFGRIGRLIGFVPRASRMVLTDLGLVFFLAWAGARAGSSFVEVIKSQGPVLLLMGLCVTIVPMVVGYLFARFVLKLSLLQTLGGMCGGMTSTPGLGAISAKTDAESPVISYAAAYPVALILMTVAAKIIIALTA